MPTEEAKNANKSRGRPKKLGDDVLVALYNAGFSDGQIARHEGVSRQAVVAARKRLGLFSCRSRGKRGCGKAKPGAVYFNLAKKALQNDGVRAYMHRALRLCKDHRKVWLATIVDPISVPHPVPGYAGLQINPNQVGAAIKYEAFAALADMVGVPGPEILELHRLVKNGESNELTLTKLAWAAVDKAGFIPAEATVDYVANSPPVKPEQWIRLWGNLGKPAIGCFIGGDDGYVRQKAE